MALITKMLDIAVSDYMNGRITNEQLMQIYQDPINNGDILEADNADCVTSNICL